MREASGKESISGVWGVRRVQERTPEPNGKVSEMDAREKNTDRAGSVTSSTPQEGREKRE